VSEATRAEAGGGFHFADVGEVAVKGRQAAVRLFATEAADREASEVPVP
jgi:class 3 adenylate cyclase